MAAADDSTIVKRLCVSIDEDISEKITEGFVKKILETENLAVEIDQNLSEEIETVSFRLFLSSDIFLPFLISQKKSFGSYCVREIYSTC